MKATSVPRDIRFCPVLQRIEIRKVEPMTGDPGLKRESFRVYLVRPSEWGWHVLVLLRGCRGTPTDGTNGGAAEANLWARWTIADTMAAFNSTLSTSWNDPARDRRDELFLEQRDMRWPRPVPHTPARERKSYGCVRGRCWSVHLLVLYRRYKYSNR